MKLKKIKFALRHPLKILFLLLLLLVSLFQSKEHQVVKFFKNNFLSYEPDFLFSKLEEYWNKYRYFAEVKEIIGTDKTSFNQKKILDIGCGYTSVLNLLLGESYGIDIVIDGLKKK